MIRWLEIAVFLGLALMLHLALFGLRPEGAQQAAGSGGDAAVSLTAISGSVAQMVETWERPVEVSPVLDRDLAEPARPQDQAAPQIAPLPERPDLQMPQLVPQATQTPDPPRIATRSARPPKPKPPKPKAPAKQVTPKPKTQKKAASAAPSTAGRQAQKAAGTGGGPVRGNSGKAQSSTLGKAEKARLLAIWKSRISAKIQRSKRNAPGKAAGAVDLVITLSRSGQILGVSVRRSSGNAALDKAALDTIRRARRFPPAPKKLPGDTFRFAQRLTFKP